MEYAPDGDLAKVIKKHQILHRPMHEDLVWKYFIQVRCCTAQPAAQLGAGIERWRTGAQVSGA